MKKKYSLSIVIPVFNEENNIFPVLNALQSLDLPIQQILFIDDGSTDETLLRLREASACDSTVQFLSFSRNFGHQAAIKAGYDFALGDCIITMDGDMQHPPALIPKMVELWLGGADVVQSRRLPEANQSTFKKYTSHIFYKILNASTAVHVEPGTADFRLLDLRVAKICSSLRENTFFWRGIIPWLGFNQQYIDYTPASRLHGTSKYTLKKMARLAWDGISSFSLMPLRFATVLGSLLFSASLLYGIYVVGCVLFGNAISGWGSLMVAILGLGSMQMLLLGLLGEYTGKIFTNSKNRPPYILKEIKSTMVHTDS